MEPAGGNEYSIPAWSPNPTAARIPTRPRHASDLREPIAGQHLSRHMRPKIVGTPRAKPDDNPKLVPVLQGSHLILPAACCGRYLRRSGNYIIFVILNPRISDKQHILFLWNRIIVLNQRLSITVITYCALLFFPLLRGFSSIFFLDGYFSVFRVLRELSIQGTNLPLNVSPLLDSLQLNSLHHSLPSFFTTF